MDHWRCPNCGRFTAGHAEGYYDAGLHIDGCEQDEEIKEDEVSDFGGVEAFCTEACADRFHNRSGLHDLHSESQPTE